MADEEHGPFTTEQDALATEACAAEKAAWKAPGDGEKFNMRILVSACGELGIELGTYDLSPLRQVAMYETPKCVALRGIIRRAFEAGKAAAPEGTVTEYGVRYARPPALFPEDPPEVMTDRAADLEAAQRMMTSPGHRRVPGDAVLVSRQVTPWKEVPGD